MKTTYLAGLAVAAVLPAQGDFTSPAHLERREGNSIHNYVLFARPGLRWQQVDKTHRGMRYGSLRSIAWRRDAGPADSAYVARTIDLEVVMAESVLESIGTDYDNNYVGPPATVFTPKPVNLPDWRRAVSGAGPEPWSIVVPFDRAWIYSGRNDLLWEVRYTSNSAVPARTVSTYYGNDFEMTSGSFFTTTVGSSLGTSGCIATGRTSPMSIAGTFYNFGSKFRFSQSVSDAPSNAPVFVNLDFSDPALTVPGLCHAVHATPLISYPLGVSSPTGTVDSVVFDGIAHNPALIGVDLNTQALALDAGLPGLPVALSDGRLHTIPSDPTLPTVARVYRFRRSDGSWFDSGPWPGGIVARFQY